MNNFHMVNMMTCWWVGCCSVRVEWKFVSEGGGGSGCHCRCQEMASDPAGAPSSFTRAVCLEEGLEWQPYSRESSWAGANRALRFA